MPFSKSSGWPLCSWREVWSGRSLQGWSQNSLVLLPDCGEALDTLFYSHLSFSGKALCHALELVVKWKFLEDGQVEMGFRPTLLGSENRTKTNKMVSDAKGTWIVHKVELWKKCLLNYLMALLWDKPPHLNSQLNSLNSPILPSPKVNIINFMDQETKTHRGKITGLGVHHFLSKPKTKRQSSQCLIPIICIELPHELKKWVTLPWLKNRKKKKLEIKHFFKQ